jgi:hypothetical protein
LGALCKQKPQKQWWVCGSKPTSKYLLLLGEGTNKPGVLLDTNEWMLELE